MPNDIADNYSWSRMKTVVLIEGIRNRELNTFFNI